jgi:segregation and condensation protein A
VSDKIDYLMAVLPVGGRVPFLSLFTEATSRSEVIITFLAMLELMKLNFLKVEQERVLGEVFVLRPSDKIFTQVPMDTFEGSSEYASTVEE